MEAKTGDKGNGNKAGGTDAVGEGTTISYSLFALASEMGQARAEAEPVQASPEQPDAATAPPDAGAARSGDQSDPLQSALDKYNEWLRTIND